MSKKETTYAKAPDREVRLSSAAHRSARRGVEDNSPSRSSIHSPSGSTALRIAHCALSISRPALRIVHCALSIALCLAMASCAVDKDFDRTDSDSSSTDTPATISLAIHTPGLGTTRSGEDITESSGDLPNELINSWWIALVDKKDGKIAYVSEEKKLETPKERDGLSEIKLESGSYYVYAFANLSPEKLKEHTGLVFKQGEKISDAEGKSLIDPDISKYIFRGISNYTDSKETISPTEGNSKVYRPEDLDTKDRSKYKNGKDRPLIPMTGRDEINTSTVANPYEIEVKRMVSKMELYIENGADYPITIKSMMIGRFTHGDIYLFNQTKEMAPPILSENPKALPKDTFLPKFDLNTYKSALTNFTALDQTSMSAGFYGAGYSKDDIANHQKVLQPNETDTHIFYLNESISWYDEGGADTFFIEINMTRDTDQSADDPENDYIDEDGIRGGEIQTIVVVPQEIDTDKNAEDEDYYKDYFTSLRRNDYVYFPIMIKAFVIDFIPSFYPPIGGYPSIRQTSKKEYEEFLFDADGLFSITPMVFEDLSKKKPLSVEVELPLYISNSDMFTVKPDCPDGSVITGVLSGTDGWCEISVRLKVMLKDEQGKEFPQVFIRKIRIRKYTPKSETEEDN